eukprot:Awhi_evm1s7497
MTHNGKFWKVNTIHYPEPLQNKNLMFGQQYTFVNPITKTMTVREYTREDDKESRRETNFDSKERTVVYAKDTKDLNSPISIEFELLQPMTSSFNKNNDNDNNINDNSNNNDSQYTPTTLVILCSSMKATTFRINLSNTNVLLSSGKPNGSKEHFRVSTTEHYGVCCIGGAKVSGIMHRWGNLRWSSELVCDLRSVNEDNKRLVGDFLKNISVENIAKIMAGLLAHNKDWIDVARVAFGGKMVAEVPGSEREGQEETKMQEKVMDLTRYTMEYYKNSTDFVR